MLFSLKGKLIFKNNNYIVIEVNNIGYEIYVANVNNFELEQNYFIYVVTINREDSKYLCGFLNLEEKNTFILLNTIKGIGPKTSLSILKSLSYREFYNAITTGNISLLKKQKNIGSKTAEIIIKELKNKINYKKNDERYENVKCSLTLLGFKSKQIDDVLSNIDMNEKNDEQIIKEALKMIR